MNYGPDDFPGEDYPFLYPDPGYDPRGRAGYFIGSKKAHWVEDFTIVFCLTCLQYLAECNCHPRGED